MTRSQDGWAHRPETAEPVIISGPFSIQDMPAPPPVLPPPSPQTRKLLKSIAEPTKDEQ